MKRPSFTFSEPAVKPPPPGFGVHPAQQDKVKQPPPTWPKQQPESPPPPSSSSIVADLPGVPKKASPPVHVTARVLATPTAAEIIEPVAIAGFNMSMAVLCDICQCCKPLMRSKYNGNLDLYCSDACQVQGEARFLRGTGNPSAPDDDPDIVETLPAPPLEIP